LATRKETTEYVQKVKELASSMASSQDRDVLRGPLHSRIGNASVSACAFAKDLIVTMSFAPLGSDDIDTKVEDDLSEPAAASGFDLSVVDAHNSIDPQLQSPVTGDPGWKALFDETKEAPPSSFDAAYCHSSEIGFAGRGDLTENGIGLLLIRVGSTKSVLVLADANNSVPRLRAEVEAGLSSAGFDMIEFCTSDSHNLAARGLTTERGYEALGEATPTEAIREATVSMAKLAETKLAPAEFSSSKAKGTVRVFGSKALDEFAAMTQASSSFSMKYIMLTVGATVALLMVSIFF